MMCTSYRYAPVQHANAEANSSPIHGGGVERRSRETEGAWNVATLYTPSVAFGDTSPAGGGGISRVRMKPGKATSLPKTERTPS
jgi:hypothetical protein